MRRLGIRGRLLVLVVTTVAVAVIALVLGFNLILGRTLDNDARELVRSHAIAGRALLRAPNGRLQVVDARNEGTEDSYLWIFSNGGAIEEPRSSPAVAAAARSLQGSRARFLDVPSADVRLYSLPVVVGGQRLGTVVAGVSVAPYEETRRATLLASLVFGGIVLVLVAIAARWILASSLRPVLRMTRQAAAWSELENDQRFSLGEPHDELTELAATLDRLLDRLAASLRRERLFSAELSHELRTPLARVLAESELALRRERKPHDYRAALELIHSNAVQLARTLDALLAAARHESGSERGTADARSVADQALELLGPLAEERRVSLAVNDSGSPLRVGVDSELATRILQPVLENAIRYGGGDVAITIARERAAIRYLIDDNGPGVAAAERERIFEPGVRGQAGKANGTAGSGLGLSLARRLARSVSGEIQASATLRGGRFVIDLPAG